MMNSICPTCGQLVDTSLHDCPGPRIITIPVPAPEDLRTPANDGEQPRKPSSAYPGIHPAMMVRRRYVITVSAAGAAVLEARDDWNLMVVPGGAPAGIPIESIEAVSDDELADVDERLQLSGSLHHTKRPRL